MKEADWTNLPDDVGIEILLRLNSCDRANLASTCCNWRKIASYPFLWHSLDLRLYKFDSITAFSLAPYCANLKKLQCFGNNYTGDALRNLQANNLKEIRSYTRQKSSVVDTLYAIAGRHPALESLEINAYFQKDIDYKDVASDGIKVIALCSPNLRKLKLSDVGGLNGDEIDSLSMHCRNLSDIKLTDCFFNDEVALGKFSSLRFLSVAGTFHINWNLACDYWPRLPNLIGLDISKTLVDFEVIPKLLSSSSSLKVLCALACPNLFFPENVHSKRDGKLLANYSDMCRYFRILIPNSDWGYHREKDKDEDEINTWLENITCQVLLKIVEYNSMRNDFWGTYVGIYMLHLMQSPQEDVQELISKVLALLRIDDNINEKVHFVEVVPQYRDKALCILLELAKSKHEGLHSEAAKAIINLCRYPSTWKSFVKQGGVASYMNLIRSSIKSVAEEAAKELSILSDKREYKDAIAEAGTEALLDLITKRPKFVLKHVTCALANLATNQKCGRKIARVGGLQALMKLGFEFRNEKVINQVAIAIDNLFGNNKDHDIRELCDIVKEINQLTRSRHLLIRGKAVAALLKLCDNEEYIKAFSAASAIQTLVDEQKVSTRSEEKISSTALWKMLVSKANSITIGQQGGVTSLASIERSNAAKFEENAVGPVEKLIVYAHNLLTLQKEMVSALVGVCATSSNDSARFTYAMMLAYMFDGRSADGEKVGRRKSRQTGVQNEVRRMALDQISAFIFSTCDQRKFASACVSMPLEMAKKLYIADASCTYCSKTKMRRLLAMLKDRSFALVAFAAFALFQFTSPCGIRSDYHRELVQNAGGMQILRDKAESKSSQNTVKVLCSLVLNNLSA